MDIHNIQKNEIIQKNVSKEESYSACFPYLDYRLCEETFFLLSFS